MNQKVYVGSASSLYNKTTLFMLLAVAMQHLTAFISLAGPANQQGNEADRMALMAIKNQLINPQSDGTFRSWNNSVHHCNWDGVTCGRKHNRVILLDLSSRGLAGAISPFIGNLSFLRNIFLSNNSLYGEIPSQVGRLNRLQTLRLDNNTLTGKIPNNLTSCINLEILSLANNKLNGHIPTNFNALSKLRKLRIFHNNFTGPLFDVIENITSLESVDVVRNSFTGIIPESIGRMRNLNFLALGKNAFYGIVPTSIFNLSSLETLDLEVNFLQGQLPADIGQTLPRLEFLNIALNRFTGTIPVSITNITSLNYFVIDVNQFTGRVPHDFGQLRNLQHLGLSFNPLVGDMNYISTLVNHSMFQVLESRGTQLTGHIPDSIANLSTSVTRLILGISPVTGDIPPGITNLINLEYLSLDYQQLTGPIPQDIGKLQDLVLFYLSSNRLTGRIPNSIGNISSLSELYLDDNYLQGSIPPVLGNCRSLLYLNLSYNELNGTLGNELFEGSAKFLELDLSHNHLEGSLPLSISKQTNLVSFDVSRNMFSGALPDSFGNIFPLQHLRMSGNSFHGSIPPSFSALTSLQTLDLSSNNFSGSIPAYLAKFPLDYLNLSFNNFEGRVPTTGVFVHVSAVSLVGNGKLCGGIPELNLPRCIQHSEHGKRKRLSRAMKLTITLICIVIGILILATLVYLFSGRKKRNSVSDAEPKETFSKVSYNMLLKATDGFSTEKLLGAGSFGSVFKGTLDEKTVAIKVLNLQHNGASKSFLAECKALRNIRHRNLVGIITACSSIDFQENDFKALVYEFMPNGSLDKWMQGSEDLTLVQRVDIAIDVAHALNYLHHECEIPIVHCDLKPSNILLDHDMVARVGDFGLAKFLSQPRHPNQSSSIGIRGSIGYAAPEYGLGAEASPEGDLYSYGVLILELMTGKRPTDNMFKEDFTLHMYAEAALPDQVLQIVDPTLEHIQVAQEGQDTRDIQESTQRRLECIVSMVSVGVACSRYLPQERMKITDVISRLRAGRDHLLNTRHMRQVARENLNNARHRHQFHD